MNNLEQNFVIGKVKHIFYQNDTNFYKVLLVHIIKTDIQFFQEDIVVTGTIGQINENENYHFVGKIITHPKYGKQFQVFSYSHEAPNSKSGIVSFLSSKKFPGIGQKTARKIVDELGTTAIAQILAKPEILADITNLSQKKRDLFVKILRENNGEEQVLIKLAEYGFGSELSLKIFNNYKDETLDIIHENPYCLVEDIEGIGFQKADSLAEKLGIAPDSKVRLQAAILHELLQYCIASGNTYLEAKELLLTVQNTLEKARNCELDPNLIADEMIKLSEAEKIGIEGTKVFEKSLFCAEHGLANSLAKLLKYSKKTKFSEQQISKALKNVETRLKINYGESQKEALKKAVIAPFFILTGGPGTGKTTVIKGLVELFAELNDISLKKHDYADISKFPILLAAPTGRAARRMNETTGLPASTIHRLLGLTVEENFGHSICEKIKGRLLIIDEFSMVDTWLANLLFKNIPINMQVILVGDKDQLPSVGPGQVFCDLLAIDKLPKLELTDIYRQVVSSSIIPLAHAIKNGKLPADFTKNKADRSFFACTATQVESYIRQIVLKAVEKGFTIHDFQILAPMYRGPAGINALNAMLQNILNPNINGKIKEVKTKNGVFRIGDKVLQLVNDAELNVFNGDFGIITGIIQAQYTTEKQDQLVIDFEGCEVKYARPDWSKITLSYACSIHKAQGSEFKLVILPLVMNFRRMLRRNLLYTAITRSREALILLGEPEAFRLSVQQVDTNRKTYLKERLQAVGLDQKQQNLLIKPNKEFENTQEMHDSPILTTEKIEQSLINPMIGMEEVKF